MQIDLFYHITPPRADGWNRARGWAAREQAARARGRAEPRSRARSTSSARIWCNDMSVEGDGVDLTVRLCSVGCCVTRITSGGTIIETVTRS